MLPLLPCPCGRASVRAGDPCLWCQVAAVRLAQGLRWEPLRCEAPPVRSVRRRRWRGHA